MKAVYRGRSPGVPAAVVLIASVLLPPLANAHGLSSKDAQFLQGVDGVAVTKVQKSTFNMTTTDGEKVSALLIDAKTEITRDGKKVAASELKAGQSVVVDAYGDEYDGAQVLEMRIVPKIVKPAPAKKP